MISYEVYRLKWETVVCVEVVMLAVVVMVMYDNGEGGVLEVQYV